MSTPTLDWQDGQPFSTQYQDIYFSRESGIAETRHVFLEQNSLAERWRQLQPGERFVVGETGFGTGLNFLCAWQLWQQIAPPKATLHFVSCELHPIAPEELRRALALWPELASLSGELIDQYSEMARGWHRLTFAQGRLVLTLLIGDVADTLPQLQAQVDAWFLDGFAPAKNPDMWNADLYQTMAKLSAPHATFATFTSAGEVRRGLQSVGFQVEKVPGYGKKREILRGKFQGNVERLPSPSQREAIVIGAGMAGSATAFSLAQRGWKVTLIERHTEIASEASGNHQGILYARLSPRMSQLSELTLSGYQYTLRQLNRLMPEGENRWQRCGLLQLAFDENEASRLQGIAALGLPATLFHPVNQVQASEIAGVDLPFGGLFFPGSGWVHPPALCKALASASGIALHLQQEVLELRQHDGRWQAVGEEGVIAEAPVVVVACAAHTRRFAQTSQLPLRSIRGQITHLPATAESQSLKTVLCTEGYAAPVRNGVHTVGATYGNLEEDIDVRAVDNIENLAMLAQLSPQFYGMLGGNALQPDMLAGRASCRCNVADYLPLVGEVSPQWPGLSLNIGHGSRGLITAMLAAEALAAQLENEPAPLPDKLMKALSPQRLKTVIS